MAYSPFGAAGVIIRVEADIRRGIPGIDISGLAEGAVREARERVRVAFRNSGFAFPTDRVLINLAPAGLKKYGAALDLPIALSIMAASGLIPLSFDVMIMGELELSGTIRPVRGVLAAIASGLDAGIKDFIVPKDNAPEAAILGSKQGEYLETNKQAPCFAAAANLKEAVDALFFREHNGFFLQQESTNAASNCNACGNISNGDFADVKGQAIYKRALEIAAAGGHNILVFGPPGAGKTMLATRLSSIMAQLTPQEAVEVTRLYSLAGAFKARGKNTGNFFDKPDHAVVSEDSAFINGLITRPPFRMPHHSASAEGILGGGKIPGPGEISLAHFGVLFMDEAPEFRKNVLQALREPLEDRVISIARAEGVVKLPADFQLLLAANPCPCGRLGTKKADNYCLCSGNDIYRYWRRIGGALLDRIEIRVTALPSEINNMTQNQNTEESSATIAQRVLAAIEIQQLRYSGTGIRRNAKIPAGKIDTLCPMSAKAKDALNKAFSGLGLSNRAYHGILRVARSIADLEAQETIDTVHILEAVQHRRGGEDPYEVLAVNNPKNSL